MVIKLKCQRCQVDFEADRTLGYCPPCVQYFRDVAHDIGLARRQIKGAIIDGDFVDPKECPHSVTDKHNGRARPVCGLCGSAALRDSFGLGTGYGFGVFKICGSCHMVLDFSPDPTGEE